ncbi:MAG: ABC transporter permease [Chloroflexota bacterium]
MSKYIARRLLMFVPVLLAVSIIIFGLMRIIPGDVAMMILLGPEGEGKVTKEEHTELRHELGLDRPLYEQYFTWIGGLLRGDAGKSLRYDTSISEEIGQRFPLTLELATLAAIFATLIAIPLGVLSGVRQDSWIDYILRVVSIGGLAMPTFWTGTLLILFLVLSFDWMPPISYRSLWEDPWANLTQLIWPGLALGYFQTAVVSRMTRSCMLEVLRQDYIRTAWSKGLKERVVVLRHALKNAILPVVTLIGVYYAYLLGGAVVMEKVFNLPGMGAWLVDSITYRDYPAVQTTILVFATIILVANLLVDVVCGWLDPRIRY